MMKTIKKHFIGVGMCGSMIVLGCFIFSNTAGAYALGTTGTAAPITTGTVSGYVSQAQQAMASTSSLPEAPSWFSDNLNAVSQWFQMIMADGAASTGAPVLPTDVSKNFGNITAVAQNLFAQFDAWFYGISHFHVALIINFIFGLVVWVFDLAKNAVDWLNSIFKSAAGK
jgi:hypothetical protein